MRSPGERLAEIHIQEIAVRCRESLSYPRRIPQPPKRASTDRLAVGSPEPPGGTEGSERELSSRRVQVGGPFGMFVGPAIQAR
jgi:hypothetical protein